jgi:hypothetical protein
MIITHIHIFEKNHVKATGVTNEEGTAYPSKASVLVGFVLFISSNEMLPVFSSVL